MFARDRFTMRGFRAVLVCLVALSFVVCGVSWGESAPADGGAADSAGAPKPAPDSTTQADAGTTAEKPATPEGSTEKAEEPPKTGCSQLGTSPFSFLAFVLSLLAFGAVRKVNALRVESRR